MIKLTNDGGLTFKTEGYYNGSSSAMLFSGGNGNTSIYTNTLNSSVVKLNTTPMEVETVYMETLYNVIVVDKTREILLDEKIVAKDQETAKFNVGVYDTLRELGITPSDVNIYVSSITMVEVDKDLK